MLRKLTLLAASFLAFYVAPAQQPVDRPMLIGRIGLNQTHIAFTYAGKIWLVDRNGGAAKRLTNTPNDETSPVFSPNRSTGRCQDGTRAGDVSG